MSDHDYFQDSSLSDDTRGDFTRYGRKKSQEWNDKKAEELEATLRRITKAAIPREDSMITMLSDNAPKPERVIVRPIKSDKEIDLDKFRWNKEHRNKNKKNKTKWRNDNAVRSKDHTSVFSNGNNKKEMAPFSYFSSVPKPCKKVEVVNDTSALVRRFASVSEQMKSHIIKELDRGYVLWLQSGEYIKKVRGGKFEVYKKMETKDHRDTTHRDKVEEAYQHLLAIRNSHKQNRAQ